MTATVVDGRYIYSGTQPLVLVKWKVKKGSQLFTNAVILTCRYETLDDDGEIDHREFKLKSVVDGTVQELLIKEGDRVVPGSALLQLQSCKHEIIMKELCAQCGADLRHLSTQNLQEVVASRSFSMVHIVPELKCSLEQAAKLDEADEARLLKSRKLILLVDLDQTLIHTTNDNVAPDLKDVYHFQLYGSHSPWYHTRLRPGTREFLDHIHERYELHIFTFGARLYAHKVASILDPDGKIFSHRILSRDECFDPTSKTGNLKTLFPRGDSMVCIIDDREDVWNFAQNVVHVKPYIFFRNTGDINAPPCTSEGSASGSQATGEPANKSEDLQNENFDAEPYKFEATEIKVSTKKVKQNSRSDVDTSNGMNKSITDNTSVNCEDKDTKLSKEILCAESVTNIPITSVESNIYYDDDDYLLYLEEILITIHKAYYSIYDELMTQGQKTVPDLKSVIPYVRRKVLNGVNLVFSAVIPNNVPPEKSSLWILAKSLGAEISHDLILHDPKHRTTHVVASKVGTAKLNRAKRAGGIRVITPSWLICCATRWERADERLFPLKKGTPFGNSPMKYPLKKGSKSRTVKAVHIVPKNEGQCYLKDEMDRLGNEASLPPPVLTFSSEELQTMGKEVEEACASTEESSDDSDSKEEGELPSPKAVTRMSKRKSRHSTPDSEHDSSKDGLPASKKKIQDGTPTNFKNGFFQPKDSNEGASLKDLSEDLRCSSSNSMSSAGTVSSGEEELAAAVERKLLGAS